MSLPATNLRVPGPTPLPDTVRAAGGRQMVNHRGPEFKSLLGRITSGLRDVFRTEHEIALLTASGTGALEAAVVNHCSPGDPLLAVSIGAFGDRFAAIAERYGADVTRLPVTWGQAASAEAVTAALDGMRQAGRPAHAVLVTHNETSTGVTNPLAGLATAVHAAAPEALLIVDGISGLGAVPFETDGWQLDVVATGSQKSWMCPPGLGMISLSPRAVAAAEQATMPRFYFDLGAARASAAKGETPWTPAVGVCFALEAALELMRQEGLPAIFARHAACAAATRAGLAALGLSLFADPAHASDTVTAAHLPEGLAWPDFSAALRQRGLVVAGGQAALAGKIFRVGHLGSVDLAEILAALDVIETTLIAAGRPVERGAALSAAARAADATSTATPQGTSGPDGQAAARPAAPASVGV
ncbi:MAG TPA: alanine--glyoxylate aminotransferase family protein [Candidatus Limnocylindrales bacterium]|nr:alanine--glyoxylate aminotransferase family protein [Candidatus Limnocylindrales bacterium]